MKSHVPPYNNAKSDLELISDYKANGDLNVLGELYQRYTALVYGVCLKYYRNKEDSQDAVMQIFEKLIDSLLKHEVHNFKSWLHVTSRNYCLMELRKRKTQLKESQLENSVIENMELSISTHHNNEDSLTDDLNLLKNCMEKLPENQKMCIDLFFISEQSYKEVSVNSGYELNKVKSYIQNGRRNLKNCIEKNRE